MKKRTAQLLIFSVLLLAPTQIFAHTPSTREYLYLFYAIFHIPFLISLGFLLLFIFYRVVRKKKTKRRNVIGILSVGTVGGAMTVISLLGNKSLSTSKQETIIIVASILLSLLGAFLSTLDEQREKKSEE